MYTTCLNHEIASLSLATSILRRRCVEIKPRVFKSTNIGNQMTVRTENLIGWSPPASVQSIKFSAQTVVLFSRFVLLKIRGLTSMHFHLKCNNTSRKVENQFNSHSRPSAILNFFVYCHFQHECCNTQ